MGRSVLLECDFSETVLSENALAAARERWEIKAQAGSVNVLQLPSGAWSITPIQDTLSNITEIADPTNSVLRAANFTFPLGYVEVPITGPDTDIVGATTGASGSLATGNYQFERRPTAGADWSAFNLPVDAAAFPPPTLPSANYPMLRAGVANATDARPDTGWLVRFKEWFSEQSHPDSIFTFYHGGTNISPVGGEYAHSFRGDGTAIVYARVPNASNVLGWKQIDRFRYAPPHQVSGHQHDIYIHPHIGPQGRYLSFRSGLVDAAPPASSNRSGLMAAPSQPRSHHTSLIYVLPTVAESTLLQERFRAIQHAAGPGHVRFDLRQNSRARVQVARLTYPNAGTLVEGPFPVPLGAIAGHNNLTLRWTATTQPAPYGRPAVEGSTVTGQLYDTATGTPLSLVTNGPNYAVFTPVAGALSYYIVWTLESTQDRLQTPLLWSWRCTKDGSYTTTRAPLWSTPVVAMSAQGAGKDPTAESAECSIEDPANALDKLHVRGDVPARLITTYKTPADGSTPTGRVELARGFINRAEAERQGSIEAQGFSGRGASRVFPDPNWHSFGCQFIPYYKRIIKGRSPGRVNLIDDPDPTLNRGADGMPIPYKVTTMLRAALGWCGFRPEQIDVPDAAIRFWPQPGDSEDSLFLEPLTEMGPVHLQWLRDYLGWFLVWDGNAGSDPGMWRVRPPTLPDGAGHYANVWTFVDGPATGRASMQQQSYAAAQGPLIRGTFRHWTVPAEGNLVMGVGMTGGNGQDVRQLVQTARNQVSADWWDTTTGTLRLTADWTHPDYLGTVQLIDIEDAGLNTQDSLNWLVRRGYDASCHTLQMFSFQAPLWFIADSVDMITVVDSSPGYDVYSTVPAYRTLGDGTVQQRPLRFYDPVIVPFRGQNVQCLVTSVQPTNEWKDDNQMATIECQAAVPLTAGS